jgi:hypothetical protein
MMTIKQPASWRGAVGYHTALPQKTSKLRSASVAPRAGSALPVGSLRLTPLLAGRSETEAEAQGEVADGGLEPVPIRGTGVVRRVAPGTTA